MEKKQIPLRILIELWEKVQPVLVEEDRSFNSYITQLIKQDLKRRGVK